MTDLDRTIAEMQGWECPDYGNGFFMNGRLYTPTTDLNQAVAAAEWLMKKGIKDIWLEIVLEPEVDELWQASFYYPDVSLLVSAAHRHPAEALCLAMKQAWEALANT